PDLDVGQMIMVGFRGMSLEEMGPMAQEIETLNLGGVILFDYDVPRKEAVRNIDSPRQVEQLVAEVKRLTPWAPLLVAIDQEGGKVSRLKERFGFAPTVSAQVLGRMNDPDRTRKEAAQTARVLSGLGINMNFSPVVDLNVNPANPIIGKLERSFSHDPEIVVAHAAATIHGFHEYGILAVIKHFPGHGSSLADSHLGFTDVTETWSPRELIPFERLVGMGLPDGVMTAHIYNRDLDPEVPATLSHTVLQEMLRTEMGFEGVIITDDLQMGAIRDEFDFQETIRLALEAGADILLFANNSVYDPKVGSKAVEAIHTLVREGTVSRERIEQSLDRIAALKARINP
ncbi:MAG: glycoside hydrolase family 3 protein, partial [Desulfovibrionales bacterium]